MNRLLFGDNLDWLRDTKEFPDASVDLVYLDPPFNSNADYNVLFREASGEASQAQFHAFTDTWSWADAAETYNQLIDTGRNWTSSNSSIGRCRSLTPARSGKATARVRIAAWTARR
jgi:adenine specific DNA methylase Mod